MVSQKVALFTPMTVSQISNCHKVLNISTLINVTVLASPCVVMRSRLLTKRIIHIYFGLYNADHLVVAGKDKCNSN